MTERTWRTTVADLVPLAAGCAIVVIAVTAIWALVGPVTLEEGLGKSGGALQPAIYCCSYMSWQVNTTRLVVASVAVAVIVMGIRRAAPLRTALAAALITASCVLVSLFWIVAVVLLPETGSPGQVLRDQPAILGLWLAWLAPPLLAAWLPLSTSSVEPDPRPTETKAV